MLIGDSDEEEPSDEEHEVVQGEDVSWEINDVLHDLA